MTTDPERKDGRIRGKPRIEGMYSYTEKKDKDEIYIAEM